MDDANTAIGLIVIALLVIGVLYAITIQKPTVIESKASKTRAKKEEAKKETIDLSKLTKLQLEAKGREIGIELDRRQLKAKLVAQLEAEIAKKGK
jgi:hypothetical protein|tara:strand:- start:548 stop:832 length:285 start_codon:yes stop_codon:yes gene_type:complete